MKVNVGHLKAHLSEYLRTVQEKGEPVEVCVREKGVAYLTPIAKGSRQPVKDEPLLEARLLRQGLSVVQWGRKPDFDPSPEVPDDGKHVANSVVAMRAERDW